MRVRWWMRITWQQEIKNWLARKGEGEDEVIKLRGDEFTRTRTHAHVHAHTKMQAGISVSQAQCWHM